ncbi:hypothetical protein [Vibrio sp. D431a]|uniref:secretion/conjugation apparatus DotM-related subunit n=1 Tax=Vibrio sp. D431a TaxID=2837388 RepID=UPI0025550F2C|nr:hypothetical protein [Vibrio sp. D431a]MDK9793813.1 hypothetical protein [Vibrio sp. D431a]
MDQSSNNGKETSMALMLTVIILMVVLPIIFNKYFFPQYAAFLYYTRYWFFTGMDALLQIDVVANNSKYMFFWVDFFYVGGKVDTSNITFYVVKALNFLNHVDTTTNLQIAKSITDSTGSILDDFKIIARLQSAFFAPVFLLLFYRVYRKIRNINEYNTEFTLDSFAETMSGGFKELLPVVYDNPQKWASLDEGHWRMSPKIKKYLTDNGCIETEETDHGEEFWLNTDTLRTLLVKQLGNKWTGFDNLSREKKYVIAAAMPMAVSPARGKDRSEKLVELLAEAYSSKPGFFPVWMKSLKFVLNPFNIFKPLDYLDAFVATTIPKGAIEESMKKHRARKAANIETNAIISELRNNEVIRQCISSHAYDMTVMARVIEKAWEGGVLPSCSFIWLKKEDRQLFYMFNNLGRSVAWVEVCGFWGHYLTEKTTNIPYPYPVMDNTIFGIDKYLLESFYGYRPIHKELLDEVV